jgi:tetratricopeptide (TPR) repeat protein
MNRGLLLSLLLVSFSALVWSSTASAGPGDKAKARAYHKAGKKAYAAGDFEEAAKSFSAGYTLDPKPGFLLNIAQSYRKADKPKKAIHYYEEYLRLKPSSRLRPQVEELIREIRQEMEAAPAPKPAADPLPAMDLTEEPEPPPKSEPIYKKWWFWTGVATVVVAASVGIGVYAGTREPDYVQEGGLGSVRW